MSPIKTIALVSAMGIALSVAAFGGGEAKAANKPKTPVTMTPEQMKWVPNASAPGVWTAVAWGDPDKGPHGAFHKFNPGFAAPLHTHTANTRIVVLSGTMVMVSADGKEMKFPAGSYYEQPNTYKHVTKCEAGSECLVYLTADAKWDMKPVETSKK